MLLYDVLMTSYRSQLHVEVRSSRTVHWHCGTPRCACATVELLRQETSNFLASNLWPPNSPDLSPVDYEIWAVMQHVYYRQIHSVDELKRPLIDVWCGLEQSIFDEAILISGEEDFERVSVLEDTSITACVLTMLILSISVTFNVTCLTYHM